MENSVPPWLVSASEEVIKSNVPGLYLRKYGMLSSTTGLKFRENCAVNYIFCQLSDKFRNLVPVSIVSSILAYWKQIHIRSVTILLTYFEMKWQTWYTWLTICMYFKKSRLKCQEQCFFFVVRFHEKLLLILMQKIKNGLT